MSKPGPAKRLGPWAWHCMNCHVEWRAVPGTEETHCWSCGLAGQSGVYPSRVVSWSNPGESPRYEEETECP